jgi:hypothetical protein
MSTFHWLVALKSWFSGEMKRPMLQAVPAGGPPNHRQAAVKAVMDPTQAVNGARVTIPATAEIYDNEPVWLQWGEPGTTGAYRTNVQNRPPLVPGTIDFKVPPEKVRWYIGKEVTVRYEVHEAGGAVLPESEHYSIEISLVPNTPTLQSAQIQGERMSARVTATFTLPVWPLMSTDQYVTVKVAGYTMAGELFTYTVANKKQVTQAGSPMAVGSITSSNLSRFEQGQQLEITTDVSFDGNSTVQAFRTLRPLLTN